MAGIAGLAVWAGQVAYFVGEPDTRTLIVVADDAVQQVVEGVRCREEMTRIVWSRDGASLFYAAADASWHHQLWRVDIANGEAVALTDYYRVQSCPVAAHPDGKTLLALSDLRGTPNLRRYNLNTGDFRKITDYATPIQYAVYDPTGERIAYSANATYNPHNRDIYIMAADGFDKRRALGTLAGAADTVCDWSGDGHYLAIMSNFDGGWQTGVLNVGTGTPTFFSPPEQNQRPVGFSPDGSLLLARGSELVVYGVADGLPVGVLDEPDLTSAAWLDNTTVVLGTAAGDVRVWNISGGGVKPLLT